jgi:hypothetical protein
VLSSIHLGGSNERARLKCSSFLNLAESGVRFPGRGQRPIARIGFSILCRRCEARGQEGDHFLSRAPRTHAVGDCIVVLAPFAYSRARTSSSMA